MAWRTSFAFLLLMAAASVALVADDSDSDSRYGFDVFLTLGLLDGDIQTFDAVPGTEPLPIEGTLGVAEASLVGEVAIRGRARLWSGGSAVLQVAHEEVDGSALTDARDELELDWLFLEHRFSDRSWLRLGRAPVVFGTRNDTRDDGVERVFHRLPYGFYRQGDQVTDTVDGLSYRYRSRGAWAVAVDAYLGQWELLEAQSETNRVNAPLPETVGVVDAEDACGGALWLEGTEGFRLGVGAQRFTIGTASSARLAGEETDWEQEFGSLEVDHERWLFRFEFRQIRYPVSFLEEQVQLPMPLTIGGAFRSEITSDEYYGEVGVRIGQKWQLRFGETWRNIAPWVSSRATSGSILDRPSASPTPRSC